MERLKKFLNEAQDPKTVEKILNRFRELLMTGEEIQYIAVQKKPAINLNPDSVALTNKRIVFCRPRNLGLSMDFEDYLWKEVEECQIKEGVLGAAFMVNTVSGKNIGLDYLPKSQARMLYRYAQEQEENMREYRRQIELENARARAGGGITVNPAPEVKKEPEKQEDLVSSLKKLKELFEQDLISQEEFDRKKAEILDKL
jgi:hypothetical protein